MLLCEKLSLRPPCPATFVGSMATLPLPQAFQGRSKTIKIDPEQSFLYDEFGVEVPFFRRGEPERRYFRISAHLYNSLAEYEYLAEVLRASQASH